MGDQGSIPGLGRAPGEGNGNPLQYSCLENPMDRSLAGYSPRSCKESDTTEQVHFTSPHFTDNLGSDASPTSLSRAPSSVLPAQSHPRVPWFLSHGEWLLPIHLSIFPTWLVRNLQRPVYYVGYCENLVLLNWIDLNSPSWFSHTLTEFHTCSYWARVSVSICVCWVFAVCVGWLVVCNCMCDAPVWGPAAVHAKASTAPSEPMPLHFIGILFWAILNVPLFQKHISG